MPDSLASTKPDDDLSYGWLGWLGFFVLCCMGVGLLLMFIAWTSEAHGDRAGRRFVIQLSRLAGSLTVLVAVLVALLAVLATCVLLVTGELG